MTEFGNGIVCRAVNGGTCIDLSKGDKEYVDENNLWHREDGPAVIAGSRESGEESIEWYKHGLLHRLDGPASVHYYGTNDIFEEWMLDGELHRLDGPASLNRDESGDIFYYEWRRNGKPYREDTSKPQDKNKDGSYTFYLNGTFQKHRIGGPAVWDANSQIEQWYENGELHRLDGPAEVYNHIINPKTGLPDKLQRWFKDGKFHRWDGPAIVCGWKKEWWENGEFIKEEYI